MLIFILCLHYEKIKIQIPSNVLSSLFISLLINDIIVIFKLCSLLLICYYYSSLPFNYYYFYFGGREVILRIKYFTIVKFLNIIIKKSNVLKHITFIYLYYTTVVTFRVYYYKYKIINLNTERLIEHFS